MSKYFQVLYWQLSVDNKPKCMSLVCGEEIGAPGGDPNRQEEYLNTKAPDGRRVQTQNLFAASPYCPSS